MIAGAGFGCPGTDLYHTDAPAYTGNGTYGAFLYNDQVSQLVASRFADDPLLTTTPTLPCTKEELLHRWRKFWVVGKPGRPNTIPGYYPRPPCKKGVQ